MSWFAEAAELEEELLELEEEVAVELLSSSEDEEVLVEEDEEEVFVAVELEPETPLTPALPLGDKPVEAEPAPVAATVDWRKVVEETAPGAPVAEPATPEPWARAEVARRARVKICLAPNILAIFVCFRVRIKVES